MPSPEPLTAPVPTPTLRRRDVRAPARRSKSAQRTANANIRYRDDLDRARTRQNTSAVVDEWKRFLTAKMSRDSTGIYIPFVLNGLVEAWTATTGDAAAQRRRMFTNVCESATRALNPTFSKSHPTRHRAADSVGIIVIPASTSNGIHFHGWLRLPHAHPHARQVVTAALESTFQTTNLWMNDVSELQQNGASLDYLAKTWKAEIRHWDTLECVPAYLFARLTEEQ